MQCVNETWLPVPQFEGLYEVSNVGRVRSLPRNGTKGIIRNPGTQRGYKHVVLMKDGVMYNHAVHRLVASAFIPNPENKPQVNHIDGNKQNNDARNLEWVTRSENQQHALRTGLSPICKNNPIQSKAIDMLSKDGVLIKSFPSMMEAARQTGIPQSCISMCCNNKRTRKTAGGFKWKYHSGGDTDALQNG